MSTEGLGAAVTGSHAGEAAGESEVLHRDVQLFGHRIHYLEAGRRGRGPLVVLLHGLAGDATTWNGVLRSLGRHAHVLAPDLLGCGGSDKPDGGDYSVGAHAATLRDLLHELGRPRAHVVGHSFGGAVAMSFAYQFPDRTQGLGLIASGGLGPDLGIALRLATLPGAALATGALATLSPHWLHHLVRSTAVRAGVASDDLDGLGGAMLALSDPAARAAFLHTVRSCVAWSGQRLSATDRLVVLAGLPALLIAGRRDGVIPHTHALTAHEHLPRSRLRLLDTGHFPHVEQPDLVADLISHHLLHDPGIPARQRRRRTHCRAHAEADDHNQVRASVLTA